MVDPRPEPSLADRRPERIARAAGFLFLYLIVGGIAGMILAARARGPGGFAEVAAHLSVSSHSYNIALAVELSAALGAVALAACLFELLVRYGGTLARLGMLFRVAEAVLGSVAVALGAARAGVYAEFEAGRSALETSIAIATFSSHAGRSIVNISILCFGIGSLAFFCLLRRSQSFNRYLAWCGIVASVFAIFLGLGSFIFPEFSGWLQYAWAPMIIAEVGTGLWLILLPRRI